MIPPKFPEAILALLQEKYPEADFGFHHMSEHQRDNSGTPEGDCYLSNCNLSVPPNLLKATSFPFFVILFVWQLCQKGCLYPVRLDPRHTKNYYVIYDNHYRYTVLENILSALYG